MGRDLPGIPDMEFDPTVSSVRMYTTYKSWWFTGLLYLAHIIVLSLAIFEQPTVGALQNFAHNKFWATVRSNWLRNVELQNIFIEPFMILDLGLN